ncbi:MAG: sulfite exporter TauE/SafE family protein [Myxococcales bacterium]|nr:sulfite exporter TauE/SafE family protein [Myxococcales bacterium]USN51688.1 MAG: sulfite exporter TauE/SafE family protein [Myxococcales bacterium]
MATSIALICLGLAAGILGGIVGIGGGIILVPALVLVFGFTQHMAQGTTLAALIPPVGLFAAYVYYKSGHVNIAASLFIALGFIIGGAVGARISNHLSQEYLQKGFALLLLFISLKMLFFMNK